MASLQQLPPSLPSDQAPSPPAYYLPPYPAPRQGGQSLVTVLLLAVLLLLLSMALGVLFFVASLTGWGGRAVGDAGQRAAETVRSTADALAQAAQDARDRLDPSHPPRSALVYDAEIDELLKLSVGQPLPGGRARALTITAIKSRDDASRPELAHYVVVHSELRQPNETKVLGVTVRRDSELRDDFLYQGEALRLSGQ